MGGTKAGLRDYYAQSKNYVKLQAGEIVVLLSIYKGVLEGSYNYSKTAF